MPSIVDPFRPTVKLLVDQLAPSTIVTMFPTAGVAGRLTVNEPAEVSAIIADPAVAVVVAVILV